MMSADNSDSGVVLVAALWLLVLLSVAAGGLIEVVRSERRIARHVVDQAQAANLAEAGIYRAIAILLERGQRERWLLDGTSRPVRYAGHRIDISIQDEFGKLDINTGADDLFLGLLRSVGLRAVESETVLDRMMDWRDADDLRRLHGAERTEYEVMGRVYLPRNGPFESVDELGQVAGVSTALLERLRPALTVFSRRSGIDPATAPMEALMALPGIDSAQARVMVMKRAGAVGLSSAPGDAAAGSTAGISDLSGRAFTLTARAHGRRDITVTRHAVVRFTGDTGRLFWIHEWN